MRPMAIQRRNHKKRVADLRTTRCRLRPFPGQVVGLVYLHEQIKNNPFEGRPDALL